jgi:predicted nucleic acid-binding protein
VNLRYIIDANILLSILISGKSQYINLLSLFEFILPDFALVEINLHKDVVMSKTKLDQVQFRNYSYTIFSLLKFIPSFIHQDISVANAVKLCTPIDIKDISYVSLDLDSNLTLLTRDEKLYKGLRKQGFKNVELFENFLSKYI